MSINNIKEDAAVYLRNMNSQNRSEKPTLSNSDTVIQDAATFKSYKIQAAEACDQLGLDPNVVALASLCEYLEEKYDKNILSYSRFDAELARVLAFDHGLDTGSEFGKAAITRRNRGSLFKIFVVFSLGLIAGLFISAIL